MWVYLVLPCGTYDEQIHVFAKNTDAMDYVIDNVRFYQVREVQVKK